MSKPKVLFLSAGNPTRSQMAEGILQTLAGDEFETASAGIEAGDTDPLALDVMNAVGIDLSGQRPKSVKEALKEHFGYVISIADAGRERAPIFPFTLHLLHWNLEDPESVRGSDQERKEVFRRVRDKMGAHVEKFVNEIVGEQAHRRVLAKAS